MDWLGENFKLVPLRPGFIKQIRGRGLPGEQQDFARGQDVPDGDRRVDAAKIGHDDVADQHIRAKGFGQLDSLAAAVSRNRIESILVENDYEGIGDDPLVVGDEHFRSQSCLGHSFLFFGFRALAIKTTPLASRSINAGFEWNQERHPPKVKSTVQMIRFGYGMLSQIRLFRA
jgi:hypothetical protein